MFPLSEFGEHPGLPTALFLPYDEERDCPGK